MPTTHSETVALEPLHQLVDRLTTGYLADASRNFNFFINQVPRYLSIDQNSKWIASVINGMIVTANNSTKDSCIRFCAQQYGHVLVLELRETVRSQQGNDESHLLQIQQLAEKIGGCLYVGTREEERILMSFSFPNLPIAA